MTRKQGIRAVLFLLVLFVFIWIANSVIGMPKDADIAQNRQRFNELYSEEKNTWDGIIIGTSFAHRAWSAPAAWEEYGMAVYPMATDGQPFVLSTSIIEEVMKYQDISFVIVELQGTRAKTLQASDARMRKVTDNMRMSLNRIQAITKTVEHMDKWRPGYYNEELDTRISYYFPLLKYHSRVTKDEFYAADLYAGTSEMKGVYEAARHVAARPINYTSYDTVTEIGDEARELLDDLFVYAEEKGIQLVFVTTPTGMNEETVAVVNGAVQYVEDHGYPVLNAYDEAVVAEIGLDNENDFIDMKHLNTAGSYKYTQYLSSWLKEIMEIPDHRGDEKYESWDEALEKYKVFYEESLEQIPKWKELYLNK